MINKIFADYEKEEKWLNNISQNGYSFRGNKPLRYAFIGDEPGKYIYLVTLKV